MKEQIDALKNELSEKLGDDEFCHLMCLYQIATIFISESGSDDTDVMMHAADEHGDVGAAELILAVSEFYENSRIYERSLFDKYDIKSDQRFADTVDGDPIAAARALLEAAKLKTATTEAAHSTRH